MSATNTESNRRNGVDDEYSEGLGADTISHVKSTGGMTISPELFEKVNTSFSKILITLSLK